MICINTCDQLMCARAAGLPDVAVGPHTTSCGRGRDQIGWQVWSPKKDLDPSRKRPWWEETEMNFSGTGPKIFEEWGKTRAAALQEALAWAASQYGIQRWKRNRMRDYVDERVFKQFPLRSA